MSYNGQLKNQQRHGFGTYIYPNSTFRYEGEWVKGKKHGKGKFFVGDAITIEANFLDGEIHGDGTKTWHNGNKYVGPFVNGEMDGDYGVYTQYDGLSYEGGWKQNKMHGHGKLVHSTGDVFEGYFLSNKPHGEGTLRLLSGETYSGEWINGEKSGEGRIEAPGGSYYCGTFAHNTFDGMGEAFDATTAIGYRGEWVRGQPKLHPLCLAPEVHTPPPLVLCVGASIPPISLTVCTAESTLISGESGRSIGVRLSYLCPLSLSPRSARRLKAVQEKALFDLRPKSTHASDDSLISETGKKTDGVGVRERRATQKNQKIKVEKLNLRSVPGKESLGSRKNNRGKIAMPKDIHHEQEPVPVAFYVEIETEERGVADIDMTVVVEGIDGKDGEVPKKEDTQEKQSEPEPKPKPEPEPEVFEIFATVQNGLVSFSTLKLKNEIEFGEYSLTFFDATKTEENGNLFNIQTLAEYILPLKVIPVGFE